MRKYNKLYIQFFLFFIIFGLSIINSQALSIETKNIEIVTPGQEVEVSIKATPIVKANGLQLRLNIIGGQVVKFDLAQGLLAIGVCDEENRTTTPQSVCLDIAKEGGLEKGDMIGTLKILPESESIKIYASDDNKYALDEDRVLQVKGLAAQFPIDNDELNSQLESNFLFEVSSLKELNAENTLTTNNTLAPAWFWVGSISIFLLSISLIIWLVRWSKNKS